MTTQPQPTGRLRGNDLVLRRSFRAPVEDVWTSITDPASTARSTPSAARSRRGSSWA